MSPINQKGGVVSSTTYIVGTYSVKSDFPKTKSFNLYLLVSLPTSLPQTDYAKLSLSWVCHGSCPCERT